MNTTKNKNEVYMNEKLVVIIEVSSGGFNGINYTVQLNDGSLRMLYVDGHQEFCVNDNAVLDGDALIKTWIFTSMIESRIDILKKSISNTTKYKKEFRLYHIEIDTLRSFQDDMIMLKYSRAI